MSLFMITEKEIALQDIPQIFAEQKDFAKKIRTSTARERIKKLKKLERAILKHRAVLAEGMWKDLHKPKTEVDIMEIYPTLSELRFAVKHLKRWTKDKRVSTPLAFFGARSKVHFEPKGVCLIISPWNYPFQLLFAPLISAIAAGNTAILKPSEFTVHTVAVMKDIINECFSPQEVVIIEGGVPESTALLKLKFNHIFFTGAPSIGKIVMEAAAKNLSSITLELGGKSPTIIDETADLETTCRRVTWAKYINAGQTCVAPDYILVHKSKKEAFVSKMIEQIKEFYSNEAQKSADYVRIISEKHHKRLKSSLDNALLQGGEVAYGGSLDKADKYIQPTLVTDVPLETELMQEEIFGPILPIITYKDKQEVINLIDSKEKPLSLYIYSKSKKNIQYFIDNTTAGGTCINMSAIHVGNPYLPFGGINNSGIGKSRGHYGFIEFSNERAILDQEIFSPLEQMMPPYNSFKQKLIDWTIKYL